MESKKNYNFEDELNILGSRFAEEPDAFDDEELLKLFEAAELAAEEEQSALSPEEQAAFEAELEADCEATWRMMEARRSVVCSDEANRGTGRKESGNADFMAGDASVAEISVLR